MGEKDKERGIRKQDSGSRNQEAGVREDLVPGNSGHPTYF